MKARIRSKLLRKSLMGKSSVVSSEVSLLSNASMEDLMDEIMDLKTDMRTEMEMMDQKRTRGLDTFLDDTLL